MKRSLPSTLKISLTFVSWGSFWILIHARIINKAGFSWSDSIVDASVSQTILTLACFALSKSMLSFSLTTRNVINLILRTIIVAMGCVYLNNFFIPEFLSSPDYNKFVSGTMLLRASFYWLMILFVVVISLSWIFFRDQQESIKRKEDAEKLSRDAELANLRQQLQPHFLFNSLNSISALVSSQPERARTMIQQLSDFLRGTLKKDDKQLVTLQDELSHLQLYLDIEKVRFGHRLETNIRASDESLQLTLPSLLLQPIVENAIKFGLYDTLEKIEISITAIVENKNLIVEIKNPFDPTTASPKKGTGFGLQSVHRRLYLVYAQGDLLQARQEEKTFITTLKIPQYA